MHDVRDFLGHGTITTTSRYLQSTPTRLEAVLARMEGSAPDAFAQDSHTDAQPPTESGADATPDTPRLLN